MVNGFTLQESFLVFESIFCFLAALLYSTSRDSFKLRKKVIVAINTACGTMLMCEYLFYVFKGSTGSVNVAIMYIVNAAVYYLVVILTFFYAMLIAVRLFGKFNLNKDMPCRRRFIAVIVIAAIGEVLVTVSQFTGIYYYFDANNVYQRGPLFALSSIVPTVGTIIVASIVVEYRHEISVSQRLVLMSYLVLPFSGGLFQVLFYGTSLLHICMGISILLMFFENAINKDKEVIKASKTEARTGLANETGYIEWLNSMKGKLYFNDYAVVVFDLRKFGDVNRKYGIENGNRVLASFGAIMLSYIEKDEILGRQYGNQFVAIVKRSNLERLTNVLKEIEVPFNDVFTGNEEKVTLSARAGIYVIERPNFTSEDILIYAGQALNAARSKDNEDVVWLTQELLDKMAENKKIESDIRKGLKNGEFVPFYQPKVDSSTNRLCGAEALSRWYHDGEIVPPGSYIPVMESSDAICLLDFCILKATCRDIAKWLEEGIEPVPVSVNFSRRNLDDAELAKKIDAVVSEANIPKEYIEIEVTENGDTESIAVLLSFVESLHKFGYKVAIDDFGSASSSLTLLREIPFDTLKIDKGFVEHSKQKDLAILTHIAQLAIDIDVDIVAEGVEQESQIRTLDELGVNVIQGYYYDRPLPEVNMAARLRAPVYEK